ncbi:hypothetical protein DSO57_1037106 [Entomophthora muscae]|uniref:Uncharacterized protein n=1 Tax=Entomophthora muscae TaxID=34485 RepID=A0ACC2U9H9_9FUNG|nr:hypothetical protein DSO57_1037106 [Entomophthora muscae]
MNPVLFILQAAAAQTLHSWSPIHEGPDSPFRFVVKIFKAEYFLCLGALYQEDLVITTATHIRLSKTLYTVYVPISNITHLNHVPFSIAGIEIHEANQNIPFTPKADLALIKLKRETVYPTGLNLDYGKLGANTGHSMFMVGWAREEIDFEMTDIAVQLNLPIHDPDDCARLNKGKWDPRVELCAGHAKVNHDAFYFLNGTPCSAAAMADTTWSACTRGGRETLITTSPVSSPASLHSAAGLI